MPSIVGLRLISNEDGIGYLWDLRAIVDDDDGGFGTVGVSYVGV